MAAFTRLGVDQSGQDLLREQTRLERMTNPRVRFDQTVEAPEKQNAVGSDDAERQQKQP